MAKKDSEKFSKEFLDQLLAGRDPKTVLDSGGLIGDLKKALAERMLNAEMDVHLAQESEAGVPNHRNGSSSKTVLTPEGSMELSIRECLIFCVLSHTLPVRARRLYGEERRREVL